MQKLPKIGLPVIAGIFIVFILSQDHQLTLVMVKQESYLKHSVVVL